MESSTRVLVSVEDIDVKAQHDFLTQGAEDGAIVTFSGQVRDNNLQQTVTALTLEHYPGMTERVLMDIAQQARCRWPLGYISIQHRIGKLQVGENIVFVGVSSTHRHAAFEAASFIMDILKTQAPFWKKESTVEGDQWLDARESDQLKAQQWIASRK